MEYWNGEPSHALNGGLNGGPSHALNGELNSEQNGEPTVFERRTGGANRLERESKQPIGLSVALHPEQRSELFEFFRVRMSVFTDTS